METTSTKSASMLKVSTFVTSEVSVWLNRYVAKNGSIPGFMAAVNSEIISLYAAYLRWNSKVVNKCLSYYVDGKDNADEQKAYIQ